MATKKKEKAKIRDLKPKKQVKGGAIIKADPCCGGEVARRAR